MLAASRRHAVAPDHGRGQPPEKKATRIASFLGTGTAHGVTITISHGTSLAGVVALLSQELALRRLQVGTLSSIRLSNARENRSHSRSAGGHTAIRMATVFMTPDDTKRVFWRPFLTRILVRGPCLDRKAAPREAAAGVAAEVRVEAKAEAPAGVGAKAKDGKGEEDGAAEESISGGVIESVANAVEREEERDPALNQQVRAAGVPVAQRVARHPAAKP